MQKKMLYIVIIIMCQSHIYAETVDKMMDSCEKENMNECYKASMAYLKGEGVEKNKEVGKSLLKIACDGGVSDACNTLHTLDTENTHPNSIKSQASSMADAEAGNSYSSSEYNKRTDNNKHSIRQTINSYSGTHSKIRVRYKHYSNNSFGFILTYPSDRFPTKILSDNGDGITLYNADRSLELKAYGSWYGNNIKEIYHDELGWAKDDGEKVTYRILRRNWFVISGIDKRKQTIFYLKTYFKAGKSISFRFVYPIRDKIKYDSLISTINNNFKIY